MGKIKIYHTYEEFNLSNYKRTQNQNKLNEP